jgi:hypothetical protein
MAVACPLALGVVEDEKYEQAVVPLALSSVLFLIPAIGVFLLNL